jgi:putative AdoMet-dependent methyltransferase
MTKKTSENRTKKITKNTIQEVAQLFQVSANTLRFYEEKGLLAPSRDRESGYRHYSQEDLVNIQIILGYRALDFTISQIQTLMVGNNSKKVLDQFYDQWEAMNQKIAELSLKRQLLETMMDSLYESAQTQPLEALKEVASIIEERNTLANQWHDRWHFDQWANHYDSSTLSLDDPLSLFENYHQVLSQLTKNVLADVKNGSELLDVGAGTGNLAEILMESGYSVVAVDQSRQMLQQAKTKLPNLKVCLGNFLKLPFESGRFDGVVTSYALHHLNEDEKILALEEMRRVLKSDGKIYIADFYFENEDSKKRLMATYNEAQREVVEDEYFGLLDRLEHWCEEKGLSVQKWQMTDLVWVVVIR